MKNKISEKLPKHVLVEKKAKQLYVVDYKHANNGDVCLLEKQPDEIKYVYLDNIDEVPVWFDGFKDNALEISTGNYCRQCECVIFPAVCNDNDWVLFIETKYTENLEKAFREEFDYPHCMIKQILSTVEFFRSKGILQTDRRATAIVSFPNLIEEFNSTFFAKTDVSELDILEKYNILIRATNSATIKSPKRISLHNLWG
jgi:hypothetical protein